MNIASAPINLDHPGTYLHWSIFTVSVANLVLIAVMVVIFGAALLLPFPKGRTYPPSPAEAGPPGADDDAPPAAVDEDADMWTNKVRRFATRVLPPGKLLPDRQPAYVASWIYVFGVAALAAFGLAVVSGFALALGGPDWWHYNPVGHFFNSLHLWSIELFMALLVIHLWGKFWMAAWRGRRAMTWITGVLAFLFSVVECFTGYVSQQNFDAQWISASGKDAFNPVGVGAFFNIMNFGQMLMWHIVLIPIVLVAFIGAHVLLVRVRGVSHPLPASVRLPGRGSYRQRLRALRAKDAAPWRGPTRRYDILKEGTIAGVIILALTLGLSFLLSSPDVPSVTVQNWARVAPADFLATSATELNGTSGSATYGPPYNHGTGSVQKLLFSPAQLVGVRQPLYPAQDFVLHPLSTISSTNPALAAALATYRAAPRAQQLSWANAYAERRHQGEVRRRRPGRPGRRGRAGAGDDGQRADHGPHRGPGRRPHLQGAVLRHQLHRTAAVHERRGLLRQPGGSRAPVGRAVGRDERDRQLPRPAVAVAVHDVVPAARLVRVGQR